MLFLFCWADMWCGVTGGWAFGIIVNSASRGTTLRRLGVGVLRPAAGTSCEVGSYRRQNHGSEYVLTSIKVKPN